MECGHCQNHKHQHTDYYEDYYGNDDDVLDQAGGGDEDSAAMATDATFQKDPEYYCFSCLSEEEVWNYLDMQVKDTSRDTKVSTISLTSHPHSSLICSLLPPPPPPPPPLPGGLASGTWASSSSQLEPNRG